MLLRLRDTAFEAGAFLGCEANLFPPLGGGTPNALPTISPAFLASASPAAATAASTTGLVTLP
jgi:hypothetical protein